MKGLLHYIIGCFITICFTSCIMEDVEPDVEMVNVSISVSLADAVSSRADEYTEAANDDEKMHTLRIVIVRNAKDGVVEHNRLIKLNQQPEIQHGIETFQVLANEEKYIYFFVNEETTAFQGEAFDFDIEQGQNFPFGTLKAKKIDLVVNNNTVQQMRTPLPMNSMYSLEVGEQDMVRTFWVTRAATKFTYVIDNRENSGAFKLTRLVIKNQALTEHYMQHNDDADCSIPVWSTETNDILKPIESFHAPHQGTITNHYDYVKDFSQAKGVAIPAGEVVTLDPVYLAETKYFGEGYGTSDYYETSLSFGDLTHFTGQLKNLPYQLPRNTHVVVTVKIKNGEVTWEVDVFPYTGVVLEPEFGL